ncbi:MAG: OmpH family outer membrane protein [Bacteroidales bacterium]|nr:OmpH family outer membrane protein [Bacteroidales bacterium]
MEENFNEEKVVGTEGLDEKELTGTSVPGDAEKKSPDCEGKKKSCSMAHWIVDALLAAAVVALFVLHFTDGRSARKSAVRTPVAEVGNGEVVFINIDSINENYELVHILTDSIDAEKQKQAVVFQNRQKSLEQKAANFERNYSSGSLTPQQAQYAQQSLQEESTRLQSDYAQALESLEIRYQSALQTIADSLNAAAKRVNADHNASYIFTYQSGGQLLYADPAHDITVEVLDELNKSFKKKKK